MIRPATPDDVDALVALERELFGEDAWSAALVGAALAKTLVTKDVSGYVTVSVAGDLADLERIGVAPAHRRSGLGRRLLDAALANATGAERVLLEVREDNAGAIAFYVSLGFTEIDRRRGYYRGGTDAVVMERRLAA